MTNWLLCALFFIASGDCFSTECVFDGMGYSVRNQHVYFWVLSDIGGESANNIVKDAEYKSFRTLENPYVQHRRECYVDYGKDVKHVFFHGEIVEDADPETFEYINQKYARDKNAVYYKNKRLTGRTQQFHVLDEFHATDGENFFYLGEVIDTEPVLIRETQNNK